MNTACFADVHQMSRRCVQVSCFRNVAPPCQLFAALGRDSGHHRRLWCTHEMSPMQHGVSPVLHRAEDKVCRTSLVPQTRLCAVWHHVITSAVSIPLTVLYANGSQILPLLLCQMLSTLRLINSAVPHMPLAPMRLFQRQTTVETGYCWCRGRNEPRETRTVVVCISMLPDCLSDTSCSHSISPMRIGWPSWFDGRIRCYSQDR